MTQDLGHFDLIVVGGGMVFLGAQLVKWIAEGFHGQPTYAQCFGAVSYSLGPFLLVRMLDAFPAIAVSLPD